MNPTLTKAFLCLLLSVLTVISCKKDKELVPNAAKGKLITANPSVVGIANATVVADTNIHIYQITVPKGTNIKALKLSIPIIAAGSINPDPEVARDYTTPQKFTITSADKRTLAVTIEVIEQQTISGEKEIISFSFYGLSPGIGANIDRNTHKITATLPATADLSRLDPTIIVSSKAKVTPGSRVIQNFTNPVNYTVTAEDGSTQMYEVILKKNTVASGQNVIYFSSIDKDASSRFVFKIFAVDADSGKEIWSYKSNDILNNSISANPVIIKNKILASFGTNYYIRDLKTGEGGTYFLGNDNNVPSFGTPLLMDNFLLRNYTNFKLRAFDVSDNADIPITEKWDYPKFGDKTPAGAMSNATGFKNAIYFGWDKYVYAIKISDGSLKWKFTGKEEYPGSGSQNYEQFSANPCVYDGIIYAPSDGGRSVSGLNAIDAETGELKWKAIVTADYKSSPTVSGSNVFISAEGIIYAFDIKTGDQRWKAEEAGLLISVSNDDFYSLYGNKINLFDAKTGVKKREVILEESIPGTSVKSIVLNGLAYFSSSENVVIAVDLNTGKIKWKIKTGGPSDLCIFTKDERVIYGIDNGAQQ